MFGFESVIGYESIKNELKMICDVMKNTAKYEKLGVSIPNGVLLHGEPGLGKTLMASSLIEESGRECLCCRKIDGKKEFLKSLYATFEKAVKCTPSIVFFDDLDKFAQIVEETQNAEEFVAIQSLMDIYRDEDVFVVATANDIEKLPNSLFRAGRFDSVIEVDYPTYVDSVKIISHYLSQKTYVEDVDVKEIAKILKGYSCADLAKVINTAGIYAGYQNKQKIDMENIVNACLRELFNAPSHINESLKNLEMVAYHEAGHAVVAELLNPGGVCLVSIDGHTGYIGGITLDWYEEYNCPSVKKSINKVMTALAGKAAVEFKFGEIDYGSSQDIKKAYYKLDTIFDNLCGYSFDHFSTHSTSENRLAKIENDISAELDKYYKQVMRMIEDNMVFLDAVAKALIDKKTLLTSDIQQIKCECCKNMVES